MITMLSLLATPASATTCVDEQVVTQATVGQTRDPWERFGNTVATGDFDNDGLEDLVVSTSEEDWSGLTRSGVLSVLYGTTGNLGSRRSTWSQLSVSGSNHEEFDHFGDVLVVGDFDGDGYDDLAFGTPLEDHAGFVDTGRIGVKYGSSFGLLSTNDSNSWGQEDVAGVGRQDFGRFGVALAAGDFDGDGVDDLAASSSGSTIGGDTAAGRVVVMWGATSRGLDGSDSESFNRANFGVSTDEYHLFGSALAAGDFNGDGKADLAIGARGVSNSGEVASGEVLIKFGATAGLKNSGASMRFAQPAISAVVRTGDWMGEHLAVGNTDGDAYDDLIIGMPKKNVNGLLRAGMVGVMRGASTTSAMLANGTHLRSTDAGGPEVYEGDFGSAVHVADLDEDGKDEVIAGMSGAFNEQGRIAVFFGTSSGPSTSNRRFFDEACMGGSRANGQEFGTVLTAGDYGDGMKLVAGDPSHTPTELGAVFLSAIQ